VRPVLARIKPVRRRLDPLIQVRARAGCAESKSHTVFCKLVPGGLENAVGYALQGDARSSRIFQARKSARLIGKYVIAPPFADLVPQQNDKFFARTANRRGFKGVLQQHLLRGSEPVLPSTTRPLASSFKIIACLFIQAIALAL
jgi:hypothetical protein